MSSVEWQPFSLGLNLLTDRVSWIILTVISIISNVFCVHEFYSCAVIHVTNNITGDGSKSENPIIKRDMHQKNTYVNEVIGNTWEMGEKVAE